jgi:hypothetical protein
MQCVLTRHAAEVKGVLSGFDRVRGTLRWHASVRGLGTFLHHQRVLLKDFREYAQGVTERIKLSARQLASREGRPLHDLPSSSLRKEDFARDIAGRDGVTDGLVCVLTATQSHVPDARPLRPCWRPGRRTRDNSRNWRSEICARKHTLNR